MSARPQVWRLALLSFVLGSCSSPPPQTTTQYAHQPATAPGSALIGEIPYRKARGG